MPPNRIEIARLGPADETWEQLVASLPNNRPLYVVARFPVDGERLSALVCVVWCPDGAPVRQKMICASAKDTLKRQLSGILCEIGATDPTEVRRECVLDMVTALMLVKA